MPETTIDIPAQPPFSITIRTDDAGTVTAVITTFKQGPKGKKSYETVQHVDPPKVSATAWTYDDDGDLSGSQTTTVAGPDSLGHVTTTVRVVKKEDGKPDDTTEEVFRDGKKKPISKKHWIGKVLQP